MCADMNMNTIANCHSNLHYFQNKELSTEFFFPFSGTELHIQELDTVESSDDLRNKSWTVTNISALKCRKTMHTGCCSKQQQLMEFGVYIHGVAY
jgi:hypothetical protein